jgi:hypothetical protein
VNNLRILSREEVCEPECLCSCTQCLSHHIGVNPLFRSSLWNRPSTPPLGLRCTLHSSRAVFL